MSSKRRWDDPGNGAPDSKRQATSGNGSSSALPKLGGKTADLLNKLKSNPAVQSAVAKNPDLLKNLPKAGDLKKHAAMHAGISTTNFAGQIQKERKKIPREIGKVEQYDIKKGFGFLISDNPPEGEPAKIFVYHTHVKTKEKFRFLKEGTKVSFIRGKDPEKNLPTCLDVKNPKQAAK